PTRRALRTRSTTRASMGQPAISSRTLPGRRVEPMRAWIMAVISPLACISLSEGYDLARPGRGLGGQRRVQHARSFEYINSGILLTDQTADKMVHFVHVHLVGFPGGRVGKGLAFPGRSVPLYLTAAVVPVKRPLLADDLAGAPVAALNVIKVNLADGSA